jgi:hypothetical protein
MKVVYTKQVLATHCEYHKMINIGRPDMKLIAKTRNQKGTLTFWFKRVKVTNAFGTKSLCIEIR